MNSINNISKSLNDVMVDITVRCMLNPENDDFYIGTFTLDKFQKLFSNMPTADMDIIDIFWKAFHIAENKYREQQIARACDEAMALGDIACEYAKHGKYSYYGEVCPNCGCTHELGYVEGVACPNCDFVGGRE